MSDAPKFGRTRHVCDSGWFDRRICSEPCGAMHSYCDVCGKRQGPCANDTPRASLLPSAEVAPSYADPGSNERHEYNHWVNDVRDSGVSPTLADYVRWSKFDDNLFWRLSCGDHQNLLDEAMDRIAAFLGGGRR